MLKTFAQAAEDYCAAAEKRVTQSLPRLLLLGALAGAFIAFAGVAASIGGALGGKLASATIFPIGLTMVLLAGSELFTGNCLFLMPLLRRNITAGHMLRNCNFLVCLAVWMAFCAQSAGGKVVSLFGPIFLFVLCGFEHSVANMYYIPAGIFLAENGEVTWLSLWQNLLPVTLGNMVGGCGLGGILYLLYGRKNT